MASQPQTPTPTTAPMRCAFPALTDSPAWASAAPAALTASRLKRSMVTNRLCSLPWSGRALISAPTRIFTSCSSAFSIGPMPQRPSRIACQMASAFVPNAHMPPSPVMTMRDSGCRLLIGSGFRIHQRSHGFDDVPDLFEILPRLRRVHLDFNPEIFLQVEDDFRQLEGVNAQMRKRRVKIDAGRLFAVFPYPGKDAFPQSIKWLMAVHAHLSSSDLLSFHRRRPVR